MPMRLLDRSLDPASRPGSSRLRHLFLVGAALVGVALPGWGAATARPASPLPSTGGRRGVLRLFPSGASSSAAPPAGRARRAVHKLSFELAFGEGSPYGQRYPSLYDQPYGISLKITREVLDRITRIALNETGAKRMRLVYGPGGFLHFPVQPSAQLDVRARPADTLEMMRIVGYLAQQTAVIASRPSASGPVRAFQVVQQDGRALADPDTVQRYWARLGELAPGLHQGFLPLQVDRDPGIRILDTGGAWTAADYPGFEAAVDAVDREFGITTRTGRLRVELLEAENDWTLHPDGSGYLDALQGARRGGLRRRLVRIYAPRVDRWIAAAFQRHLPRDRAARAAPAPGAARRPLPSSRLETKPALARTGGVRPRLVELPPVRGEGRSLAATPAS